MPRTFVYHPRKGPKRTPKLVLREGGRVRIKQVRSGIGHPDRLRRTLQAMGLRHHQAVIDREVTPGLVGQIKQVRHLVQVTPLEE